MADLIASIVLAVSLGGVFFIVGRRIPALLELQDDKQAGSTGHWTIFLERAQRLIRKIPALRQFSWQVWAEKSLSKARLLALKADNKITGYLTALHVWEEEKKNGFAGTGAKTSEYWTDVKKFVRTKSGLKIKPLQQPEAKQESDSTVDMTVPEDVGKSKSIQAGPDETQKEGDRKRRDRKRSGGRSRNW